MWLIAAAVTVLTAPFALRTYFMFARRFAKRAHQAWRVVEQHAGVLLEDRRLDPDVGDLVEMVVEHIGDGSLTRAMWRSLIFGRVRRRPVSAIHSVTTDQEKQLLHFMVAALFYDSLRVPLRGALLRRVVYWLAATAIDRSAPLNRVQVQPMMSAAQRLCATG